MLASGTGRFLQPCHTSGVPVPAVHRWDLLPRVPWGAVQPRTSPLLPSSLPGSISHFWGHWDVAKPECMRWLPEGSPGPAPHHGACPASALLWDHRTSPCSPLGKPHNSTEPFLGQRGGKLLPLLLSSALSSPPLRAPQRQGHRHHQLPEPGEAGAEQLCPCSWGRQGSPVHSPGLPRAPHTLPTALLCACQGTAWAREPHHSVGQGT